MEEPNFFLKTLLGTSSFVSFFGVMFYFTLCYCSNFQPDNLFGVPVLYFGGWDKITNTTQEFAVNFAILWIWYLVCHRIPQTKTYKTILVDVLGMSEPLLKVVYNSLSGATMIIATMAIQREHDQVIWNLAPKKDPSFAALVSYAYTFGFFGHLWVLINRLQKGEKSIVEGLTNMIGLKWSTITQERSNVQNVSLINEGGNHSLLTVLGRHPKHLFWCTTLFFTPLMGTVRLAVGLSCLSICLYGAFVSECERNSKKKLAGKSSKTGNTK